MNLVSDEKILSVNEQCVKEIENMILSGELKPGERLKEQELADTLEVSRTPIREAIKELNYRGLVGLNPRKGACVISLSKEELSEVMDVREVLEGLAARLAIPHLSKDDFKEMKNSLTVLKRLTRTRSFSNFQQEDYDFHGIIIANSRNTSLSQMLESVRNQIKFVRNEIKYFSKELAARSYREHRRIFEALSDKDPELAEKVMRIHIRNAKKSIVKILENHIAKERAG